MAPPAPALILSDSEDAFGHLLLDHFEGTAGSPLLERDDGNVSPAVPADYFFLSYEEWPQPERDVFNLVNGRVLDVGCGAGRHSLVAQGWGLSVVAIDISPGAVAVSRRRGVRDVRLLPLDLVDDSLGTFDTVLMMCGNFGLAGSEQACAMMLRMLHRITSPDAKIILDTVDPHIDNDGADLAYVQRDLERGRMPGQVTIRIRYGERVTPWFDLLCLSASELKGLARPCGWDLHHVALDPPDLYAVLEKTRPLRE